MDSFQRLHTGIPADDDVVAFDDDGLSEVEHDPSDHGRQRPSNSGSNGC